MILGRLRRARKDNRLKEDAGNKRPFIVMPTHVRVRVYDVCVDADCLLGMLEQVSTIGKKAVP